MVLFAQLFLEALFGSQFLLFCGCECGFEFEPFGELFRCCTDHLFVTAEFAFVFLDLIVKLVYFFVNALMLMNKLNVFHRLFAAIKFQFFDLVFHLFHLFDVKYCLASHLWFF